MNIARHNLFFADFDLLDLLDVTHDVCRAAAVLLLISPYKVCQHFDELGQLGLHRIGSIVLGICFSLSKLSRFRYFVFDFRIGSQHQQ